MMPLEGYRLLDLSRLQPGPAGTHVLADMGMDVIKIEEPEPRAGMPRDVLSPLMPEPDLEVQYAAYNAYARNKRSIAIDLRTEEGRNVLYRLVESADALIEGYRPGTMKRMGCDYETLAAINPRLVYCSISGYGQDGPYVSLPGHDRNYCALAGQIALQRDENGTPVDNGVAFADVAGGLHAAIGIMGALMARERTGRGQYIDVSLSHSVMSWMLWPAQLWFRSQQRLNLGGDPLGVLKCKDGRFITTANGESHFYRNFCNAIGRPEYVELYRPTTPEQRTQRESMVEDVKQIFLTKTRDEWFEILRAADTCVAPVLEIDEVFDDPQHRHRGMLLEVEHPERGTVKQLGPVIGFSDTPFEFRNFAPVLGEHTEEILREAGYDDAAIAALEASRAVRAWRAEATEPASR